MMHVPFATNPVCEENKKQNTLKKIENKNNSEMNKKSLIWWIINELGIWKKKQSDFKIDLKYNLEYTIAK